MDCKFSHWHCSHTSCWESESKRAGPNCLCYCSPFLNVRREVQLRQRNLLWQCNILPARPLELSRHSSFPELPCLLLSGRASYLYLDGDSETRGDTLRPIIDADFKSIADILSLGQLQESSYLTCTLDMRSPKSFVAWTLRQRLVVRFLTPDISLRFPRDWVFWIGDLRMCTAARITVHGTSSFTRNAKGSVVGDRAAAYWHRKRSALGEDPRIARDFLLGTLVSYWKIWLMLLSSLAT